MYRNYGLYLLKHFVVALTQMFLREAGGAALIDTFGIDTGDSMACRAFFPFCLIIAL